MTGTSEEQALHRRIKQITPADANHMMNSLKRELDSLREEILKKDRSRPDAKILLKGAGSITQLEILAVAATRLRSSWDQSGAALDALEAWRRDWNVVVSAALVHAKAALMALDADSPERQRAVKTVADLVDLIGATFRPLTGPQAKWLAVQAKAVDQTQH